MYKMLVYRATGSAIRKMMRYIYLYTHTHVHMYVHTYNYMSRYVTWLEMG